MTSMRNVHPSIFFSKYALSELVPVCVCYYGGGITFGYCGSSSLENYKK